MVIISFALPTQEQIHSTIEKAVRLGLNYQAVGQTDLGKESTSAHALQKCWLVDHKRIKLGHGKKCYQQAKGFLQRWGQFQLSWARVSPETCIKLDSPVCVTAKSLFLWTANPLKIVYVTDAINRRTATGSKRDIFAFAQGCLHGHLLAGEERFSVERNHDDDSVWYEQLTFSRPAHPLSLVTYPLVRWYQHKFGHDAAAAMLQAVDS